MPAATTRSRSGRDDRPLPVGRPRNDAYTVLLLISLLATLAGCAMLYLDYSKYGDAKPPTPPQSPIKKMMEEGGAPAGNAAAGQPGR